MTEKQKTFVVGAEIRVKTALHGAIEKYAGTESVITRIDSAKGGGERLYFLHTDQIADPLVYFFADELEAKADPSGELQALQAENEALKAALEPFAGIYQQWLDREVIQVAYRNWLCSTYDDSIYLRRIYEVAYKALQSVDNQEV